MSDDCGRHGTCRVSGNGHTCDCDGEYGGATCQRDPCQTNDDCGRHGTCSVSGNDHTCDCDGEYGGPTCQRDPCQTSDDCGSHGTCSVSGNGHTCNCDGEYGGATCQRDPCQTSDNCIHRGTCVVTRNKHTCDCTSAPGWDGDTCATCTTPCDATKKPAANAQSTCGEDLCYQASCSATCRAGYTGSDATYTCNLQGSWESNAPLSCTAVPCSATRPTPNAASCAAGQYEGPQCQVDCNPGYESSDTPSTPATCGSDGKWQGGSTCSPKSCGTITPVDSTGCGGTYHYDDGEEACTATCDTGFTLTGVADEVASTDFYCGTDGGFEDSDGNGIDAQMNCQREFASLLSGQFPPYFT
jgi:hypothetical protein